MNEALLKVKMDLGTEAIIEEKRQIQQGGFLGFFQETLVEVDAKLPENTGGIKSGGGSQQINRSPGQKNSKNNSQQKGGKTWQVDEPAAPDFSPREHAARLIDQKGKNNNQNTYSRPRPGQQNDNGGPKNNGGFSTGNTITEKKQKTSPDNKETREKLARVIENTDLLSEKVDELSERLDEQRTQDSNVSFPGRLNDLYERLKANRVREEYVRDIISRIRKRTSPDNIDNLDFLLDQLKKIVEEDFVKYPPLNTVDNEPVLIPFVGPTGVGKTTTLAKLAAYFFSMEQESVGFITMDHYRLMAVEQLASYADILQVPLIDVSEEEGDFTDAVEKMTNKQVDMIFIDTAGRSQFNSERVNNLQTLKETDYQVIPHLVLSATSRPEDISSILDGFAPVDFERLVVSKLDETRSHGALYNLLRETDLPIAYLTDGQGVPDDLQMAEPDRIAELIAEVED